MKQCIGANVMALNCLQRPELQTGAKFQTIDADTSLLVFREEAVGLFYFVAEAVNHQLSYFQAFTTFTTLALHMPWKREANSIKMRASAVRLAFEERTFDRSDLSKGSLRCLRIGNR